MRTYPKLPGIRHLRAFDMVAQTGSALAAAGRLRISQPAVTYSLDKLEEELGVRLFDRGSSGSFLTASGAIFRERTSRCFHQILGCLSDAAGLSADSEKTEALAWKLREVDMRALIAIWQQGSFRRAAAALGIAEPSLQRPARDLERLLRTTLYRRTATGVEVNACGAELARRIALALNEIWAGIEEIGAPGGDVRPSLRVGVLALSPRMILTRAMGEVIARSATQQIEVMEGPYESLSLALRNGDIDLIFGALRLPPPFEDLEEELLLEDPYVIVCRAGHPLLSRTRVEPEALASFEFVLPTRGLPRRAVLDRMIEQWGIRPQSRIETSCLATIVAMLRTSDRLTLLSRWHVGEDGLPDLRCLEGLHLPHDRRVVGLTTRRDWRATPFQASFIMSLRRAVEELEPSQRRRPRRHLVTAKP